MSMSMVRQKTFIFSLGVLLASSWQFSVAAGWVTGKVTAVYPAKSMIEIDGFTLELPSSGKRELQSKLNEIKVGQAVQYESDGKRLIHIQPVKGIVDFPVLAPPPSGGSIKTAPNRK
jgi:hypothetical protein